MKDISGQKFGFLTAISLARISPGRAKLAIWNCRCDCGAEGEFYGSAIRPGKTLSCGCKKADLVAQAATRHGMTHSTEYNVWKGMIARCTNSNDPFFESYGGRGITVCQRWRESFENFFADMGFRPAGTTLDREENSKGYEPSNCRWADSRTQALNRRTTVRVTLNGKEMCRKEAAGKLGISVNSLRHWMKQGLTPDDVLRKKEGRSTVEGALVE